MDLPAAVELEEGTYWVSVQPVMDYFLDGNWLWYVRDTMAGAEFHWREGGGYDTGCTDWTTTADCELETADRDLSFRSMVNWSAVVAVLPAACASDLPG